MENKKNKWVGILKVLWVVAVIAGGIYYVIKNYTTTINYLENIEPWKLILSGVIIIIVRLLNIDMIEQSLTLVGWYAGLRKTFSFISITQLGKYIPGGIWQFVGRFEAYKEANITYKNMGKAFIVENIWLVAGSFFVSMAFILFSKPVELLQKYHIFIQPKLMILLGWVSLFLWLTTIIVVEWITNRKGKTFSTKRIARIFVLQTIQYIIYGLSFYCLFSQSGSIKEILYTIGAFGLSFLAGYVVIIAPGGIGVREYVAVLLFTLVFSSKEIGVNTIVHRLIYTFVEFAMAGVALLLIKNDRNRQQRKIDTNDQIENGL